MIARRTVQFRAHCQADHPRTSSAAHSDTNATGDRGHHGYQTDLPLQSAASARAVDVRYAARISHTLGARDGRPTGRAQTLPIPQPLERRLPGGRLRATRHKLTGSRIAIMAGNTHHAGMADLAAPEVMAKATTTATATRQSSPTMKSYQNPANALIRFTTPPTRQRPSRVSQAPQEPDATQPRVPERTPPPPGQRPATPHPRRATPRPPPRLPRTFRTRSA